jgi:RNA polymerase sigma-70 factor (sigma-E family)
VGEPIGVLRRHRDMTGEAGPAPGARDDYGEFVTAAYARLIHAADLLTGDRARAEDLVQHALVRTYLKWSSIESSPEAYTRKIIINAYLDWWRRIRWRELPERSTDDGAHLPDHAIDVARRDAVQRALGSLTRRERAVVVLRFWCDLSEAQIAAELGVARGTVKSTLARAVQRLRASEHLVERRSAGSGHAPALSPNTSTTQGIALP